MARELKLVVRGARGEAFAIDFEHQSDFWYFCENGDSAAAR